MASVTFAHRARPTPLNCRNEYLVLALGEETAIFLSSYRCKHSAGRTFTQNRNNRPKQKFASQKCIIPRRIIDKCRTYLQIQISRSLFWPDDVSFPVATSFYRCIHSAGLTSTQTRKLSSQIEIYVAGCIRIIDKCRTYYLQIVNLPFVVLAGRCFSFFPWPHHR